jgi:epsilon-lactone hydrolase
MRANLPKLVGIERARLLQNLGADGDLAYIVQGRAEPQILDALAVPAKAPRNQLRVRANPRGVPSEAGITHTHRGRIRVESSHRTQVPATATNPFLPLPSDGMPSSAESQRLRAEFAEAPAAPEATLEERRAQWEAEAALVPLPTDITVTPLVAGGVPCELISVPDTDPGARLMYLHGGGFVSGSCVTHRDFAARMSRASGAPVVLVDYRLAPEHPSPAATDDAVAVYRSLLAAAIEPSRIAFAGDSAGGGLTASALVALRDLDEPLPAAGVLLSAWLDMTLAGESYETRAAVDLRLTRAGLADAAVAYVAGGDARHPLASPVFADLQGLPPLLIHVGDEEILRSDSVLFAERAREVDVDVELEIWPEMWHVWHAWAAELPEAREAIARIGEFLRRRLATFA